MSSLSLVATCALGLEEILERELQGLGASKIDRQPGAVAFAGRWEDVWRTSWRLRSANRVLVTLGSWDGTTGESLTQGAHRLVSDPNLHWDGLRAIELFHPDHTLAVTASSRRSAQRDVRWIALKTKDGLVDGQRERWGRRSSVSRKDPDVPLRLFLDQDRATLLLDTSGVPLDRRGYRHQTTEAPVREQLAAACVLAAGWDGTGPVVDPMCGSGTLLAEAAAIALGRSPGHWRPRDLDGPGWAFEGFPNFDPVAFAAIQNEPIPRPGPGVALWGIDHSAEAIEAARTNLTAAGLAGRSVLLEGDAFDVEPPPVPEGQQGLFIVNPPYGERLDSRDSKEDKEAWKRLGDLMKQRYAGFRAVVLAGGASQGKHIGLKASQKIPVKNGPLEAKILVFELY